jgi:hypothetical protein
MINDSTRGPENNQAGLRVVGVVVVTPSATYHPWNAALTDGIRSAGYEPIPYGGEPPQLSASDRPKIIITHDPLLVTEIKRDWTVAILGDITTSAAQCASLFGAAPEGGLQIASLILANSALLPRDTVYLPNSFTRPTVTIGPNIEIVVPTTREEWPPLTAEQAFQKALALYQGWPDTPQSSARWEPEVFRFDDRHRSASRPDWIVELAGRARALVYGPYIGLRPGRWSITARFIVDKDAALHRLRFEWGHTSSTTSFTQSPERPGEFAVRLTHEWHEPATAEFKIIVAQGSLGGELEFQGADLVREGDPIAITDCATELETSS